MKTSCCLRKNLILTHLFASSSEPSVLSSSSLVNLLLRVGFLFLSGTLLWPGLFEGGGGDPFKSLSLSEEFEFQESLKNIYYKKTYKFLINLKKMSVNKIPLLPTFSVVIFRSITRITVS